ncbi:MAG: capsule assembly Wzi family protein [Gemmatimonadota bacterium]|nr:capsule assembly Wzi family protein [Gemmatimonadota bacterium]
MQRSWVTAAVSTLLLLAAPSLVDAQQLGTRSAAISYPTSDANSRTRIAQLAGDTARLGAFLLRSPSTVLFGDTALKRGFGGFTWLRPDLRIVANAALPYSANDGGMWAARGVSERITAGGSLTLGGLRVVLAPELWATSNADYNRITQKGGYYYPQPLIPESRYGNGYASEWYVQPFSADLPWRFGKKPLQKLVPGQSGAWYDTGPVQFGATTENMWWGPGIRNAIIMSDNAAGIPRLELRTSHPINTRIGAFEGHWLVGALSESQYFDTTKANDVRSLAAAAVTWRPVFQPTLTLGVSRAVYATATGYSQVLGRWFDVFANTGQPANHAATDSSLTPGGRDQLFSLFARWVFPDDGFETYAEWARQELPVSLHDFVVDPTHSHGYTLGLQYRRPGPLDQPTFTVQGEVTTLEQSGDFKNRPVGVFYTSRRVIQGYTQLGLPIGASFGPGGSSQWLAVDRVWARGQFGVTFNRTRWNEDVRSTYTWPAYLGYCNHDVSLIPGVRGGHVVGGGYISASMTFEKRLNYNFQNVSGCTGSARVDVSNPSLSISFSPFK